MATATTPRIQDVRDTLTAMRTEMEQNGVCRPGDDLYTIVCAIDSNLAVTSATTIGQQIQSMVRATYCLGRLYQFCQQRTGLKDANLRSLYREWREVSREMCRDIERGCDFTL